MFTILIMIWVIALYDLALTDLLLQAKEQFPCLPQDTNEILQGDVNMPYRFDPLVLATRAVQVNLQATGIKAVPILFYLGNSNDQNFRFPMHHQPIRKFIPILHPTDLFAL